MQKRFAERKERITGKEEGIRKRRVCSGKEKRCEIRKERKMGKKAGIRKRRVC